MPESQKDMDDTGLKVERTKKTIVVLRAIEDGSIVEGMRANNVRGLTLKECEPVLNMLAMDGQIRLDIGPDPRTGTQKLRSIAITRRLFADQLLRLDESDDKQVRDYVVKSYAIRDMGREAGLLPTEEKDEKLI